MINGTQNHKKLFYYIIENMKEFVMVTWIILGLMILFLSIFANRVIKIFKELKSDG